MSKSKLVEALALTDEEFYEYTVLKSSQIRVALRAVIYRGWSYKKAGDSCGITKCAIYDHLIKMYEKKYGRKYSAKDRN